MTAQEILNAFIVNINKYSKIKQFECRPWVHGTRRISRNILDLSGSIDFLIYVKVRSEEPFRWGVTANRIDEMRCSGKNWIVVLLYCSSETGYLLTPRDIDRYLSIWPLGNDGDYKVGTGSYLRYNIPFCSFKEFLYSLCNLRD